jgi:hypothetical protein
MMGFSNNKMKKMMERYMYLLSFSTVRTLIIFIVAMTIQFMAMAILRENGLNLVGQVSFYKLG